MEKHLCLRFIRHPNLPPFDASLGGARVPRDRRYANPGTPCSSSGLVRPTFDPGASLPQDLTEDPFVAHMPASDYTGDVIMYSMDKGHDDVRPKQLASG